MLAGLMAFGAISACGFTPVYAPGGAGSILRGQVRAADPVNNADFDFVAALEERLGRPGGAARFALDYQIRTEERGGLDATRNTLFGNLRYVLRDSATGEVVSQGSLRNFTTYSTTDTQLSVRRAQEDAARRLMRLLADQVATRLLADVTP